MKGAYVFIVYFAILLEDGQVNVGYIGHSSCSVYIRGFPGGTNVKNLSASAGDVRDMDLIPGLERCPGGEKTTHSSMLA